MQLKIYTRTQILIHFYSIVAELITYLYLILKIYRILCFSKITFDQMPRINPYKWPFSFIRITTNPYFKFWSLLMPKLRIGSGSYDISSIIGLEMLSTLISTSYKIRLFSLLQAQRLSYLE